MTHKLTAEQRVARFNQADMPDRLRVAFAGAGILPEAARVVPFTVLSVPRLVGLIDALRLIDGIDGDTIEIGCNAGGTSRLIALLNGKRRHWACDTFGGLVDCGPLDKGLSNGDFTNRLAKAGDVASRLSDVNATVVAGVMPGAARPEMTRFALSHVDVDTYQSMLACFEFVADRTAPGGVIVLDDVLEQGTAGGKAAWAEIMARHSQRFKVVARNVQQAILKFN